MNYQAGLALAEEAKKLLSPACKRIEIAGGVRRKKQEPHDIELVCSPAWGNIYGWFGGQDTVNMLDAAIILLLEKKVLAQGDPDKAGKKAPCGPRYYRLRYKGEKLDVFCVLPPAQWGVIFAIRTGDADFSHWLVQQGNKEGIVVSEGRLAQTVNLDGSINRACGGKVGTFDFKDIETPEEEDVFRALGVPYLPPEQRIGAPKMLESESR